MDLIRARIHRKMGDTKNDRTRQILDAVVQGCSIAEGVIGADGAPSIAVKYPNDVVVLASMCHSNQFDLAFLTDQLRQAALAAPPQSTDVF